MISDSSDDHFSDAQSGVQSGRTSPVPVTRVERIDDELAHGEVPGTDAFDKRRGDATPDEIITPTSRRGSAMSLSVSRPSTPGGQPIPTTVVEKIDPTSASHGEVPGTDAHAMRTADAVPDLVVKVEGQDHISPSVGRSRAGSTPGDLPIPTTRLERVDASPSHGEVPGTAAYEMRKGDAAPDEVEEVGDAPGKRSHSESSSKDLTGSGSPTLENNRSTSLDSEFAPIEASTETEVLAEYNEADDAEDAADGDKEDKEEADGGFGDDFDDFEEGDEDAEFGDFDDGFQEPEAVTTPTQSIPTSIPTLAPSFVSSLAINFVDKTIILNHLLTINISLFWTSTSWIPQKTFTKHLNHIWMPFTPRMRLISQLFRPRAPRIPSSLPSEALHSGLNLLLHPHFSHQTGSDPAFVVCS